MRKLQLQTAPKPVVVPNYIVSYAVAYLLSQEPETKAALAKCRTAIDLDGHWYLARVQGLAVRQLEKSLGRSPARGELLAYLAQIFLVAFTRFADRNSTPAVR